MLFLIQVYIKKIKKTTDHDWQVQVKMALAYGG